MKGLLRKAFLEHRGPAIIFGSALAVITAALTILLPKVLGELPAFLERLPFVRPILAVFLQEDPGENFSETMIHAFLWVHPTVLTSCWAYAVIACTRMPAGEVDRGTIDFLLGQPVTRSQVYWAETGMTVAAGLWLVSCALVGHFAAVAWRGTDAGPGALVVLQIAGNLLLLYLAVAGLTLAISSWCDRRGRAVGTVFGILLAFFLLNVVTQVQGGDSWLKVVSLMHYYRPIHTIRTGVVATGDLVILGCIAGGLWGIGRAIFLRRRICTV